MDNFIVIFLILFIITFILIFNKDRFMGLFYFVLFVYCFFTICAYTYFPNESSFINHVSGNSTQLFWFKLYIALAFAFFNLFYFLIFRRYRANRMLYDKDKTMKFSYSLLVTRERKPLKGLFILSAAVFAIYLGIFLILNYSQLSYYNQGILKSNKIIYLLFDYCFIFIFICLITYRKYSKLIYGKISLIIGILISLIFIIIALKIGNRGVLIGYSIAIVYYICEKYSIKINLSNLKKILLITLVVLIVIGLSQFIRKTRGGLVDFANVNFSFSDILDFFGFKELVFQDYATPSATLLYSMSHNIVIPEIVVLSDILNIPVIFDYITLGEYLSRLVSPSSNWGIGYYILTWGYNAIGFIGCMITPLILIILYKIYYRMFFYINDPDFGLFIQTVVSAYLILPIVRGQMYPFFKYIYVYFIPAILVYCIAIGMKIKIKKNQ